MRRALLFALLATSVTGLARGPAGAGLDPSEIPGPALPASVVTVSFSKQNLTYPVLDADGTKIGDTVWRVLRGTGNCCENHLAATSTGRLVDFGGTYLNFSDDLGQTWKRVRPVEPFVGGEGTVVIAPNGDVLGIAWDVYSGDRLVTFKQDAKTQAWTYMYDFVHTPVFDREWVAVVPKPFPKSKATPYMSILRGGWPSKDVWYYSFDGLNYLVASNKGVTRATGGPISRWLPTDARPEADWIQPISASSITPLPSGGALARQADLLDGFIAPGWSFFDRGTLRWLPFRLGDGSQMPEGRLVIDSDGRAHLVSVSGGTVTYRISADGGRTWAETEASLPAGHVTEEWDLRANGVLHVGVVAIHAHHGGADQDLVMRFDTSCDPPRHLTTQLVGKGDLNASSGLGAAIRFDFATMTLLPGGRVATSMMDSGHTTPALAIELDTTIDPEVELPEPGCAQP